MVNAMCKYTANQQHNLERTRLLPYTRFYCQQSREHHGWQTPSMQGSRSPDTSDDIQQLGRGQNTTIIHLVTLCFFILLCITHVMVTTTPGHIVLFHSSLQAQHYSRHGDHNTCTVCYCINFRVKVFRVKYSMFVVGPTNENIFTEYLLHVHL